MRPTDTSHGSVIHLIKASAGSGKTHRLTGEYLQLLFSGQQRHRHILAVTFTNKATDEMKSRIVEELYHLASGATSDYLESLERTFSRSGAEIRSQAKEILETILHDYSAFSISTIDRFFQQIMRAFTRELGLSGGYNIEIDERSLLTEAVDRMLSELDRSESGELSDWLLRFMKDRIREGKNWRIEQQVLNLAGELFDETYKSFTREEQAIIRDKEQLEEYKQRLVKIVKSYENEVKEIGVKALRIMAQQGLSYSDFKHKRNSGFMIFEKLANRVIEKPSNRLITLVDNIDLWFSDPAKEGAIRAAYEAGLNQCVKEIIARSSNDLYYQTAKQLLLNFYTLGILNDIKKRLQKMQQENNTLLISDTTELLNDIIDGTDPPFIYEKTGTRLTNYMIDEFQDTSRMQWDNFKPLIAESLASGHFNLIVGDVKQSIYRFRNSDWQLLEEQVEQDFHSENIQKHLLNTNWRSDARIVRFNNFFFKHAAALLQEAFNNDTEALRGNRSVTQITDAYADVSQSVPAKKANSKGEVKVTFLPSGKESDWRAEALKRLPREIEALQDQGFTLKDIAIVVRWNREAVQVAEALLTYREQHPGTPYRYDLISNEALLISNAQSVKAVIALMRYFQHTDDKTFRMMAAYEYNRFHRKMTPEEALHHYREKDRNDFPETVRKEIEKLSTLPFYEMIESFFALSANVLDEKENAYIQAFLDIALTFHTNTAANLNDFLDWWDEEGNKKTLFSPEGQDAIRLITIHKSKGLGFGAVIMPFVDWKLDHETHHNEIIWCRPRQAPFDRIGVAPLKYTKALGNTIFREDYLKERCMSYIDNLNLLYVAFTRPKHRLIAFAPAPVEKKSSNKDTKAVSTVADLLWWSLSDGSFSFSEDRVGKNNHADSCRGDPADAPLRDHLTEDDTVNGLRNHTRDGFLRDHLTQDDDALVFEYGYPEIIKTSKETTGIATVKTGQWQSIPFDNRLMLRLNSIGYFSDDGSRDYGRLMHDIMSRVKTLDDVPEAVERKIAAGELGEQDKEEVLQTLTSALSLPGIEEWYSGKYTILNENQMVHPRFGFSRPDRVMIGADEVIIADYKFGGSEETKYTRQVQRYVQTVKEMGYPHVKGFLFYVKLGKIEEV